MMMIWCGNGCNEDGMNFSANEPYDWGDGCKLKKGS